MSIRQISKELQAKAIAELNENPSRVREDIQYIKEWLRKQPHLNPRMDDQFILTYLRGSKFSLEKTKVKLDMLYTLKSMLPEFFSNRDPFRRDIQEMLKIGAVLPLTKVSSPESPRVVLIRGGKADPSTMKLETFFILNLMIASIMAKDDDQLVISGLVLFHDMTGLSIKHMAQLQPALAKKSMTYFQQAHPTRPKEMHFFNIPSFFDSLLGIIKPFMKEKVQKRIYAYNTNRIEEMHQYIPKSILPAEYGGDAGPIQDLIDYWKKKVEDHASWFQDDTKYCSDESKRFGKPKTSNDVFGIEESMYSSFQAENME